MKVAWHTIWTYLVRWRLWLVGLVSALVVGLAYALPAPQLASRTSGPRPSVKPSPALTPMGELITVDVEGAVAHPGLHRLPAGSMVDDAIVAAGSITDRVDATAAARLLNRADVLKDHQKIYVPLLGMPSAPTTSNTESSPDTTTPDELVNLNTATQTELESLPGVGPSTAQKIIHWREVNGPFQSVEDLKQVQGIGDAKYNQLKDLVTV